MTTFFSTYPNTKSTRNTIGALVILAIAMAQPAFAQAILVADDAIKITAINGNATDTVQSPQQFSLTAGQHTITAYYDWHIKGNNQPISPSSVVNLQINLADDYRYRLMIDKSTQVDNDSQPPIVVIKEALVQVQSLALLAGLSQLFGINTQSDHAIQNHKSDQSPSENKSLEQLKQLWHNASQNDKQQLYQWIQQQNQP